MKFNDGTSTRGVTIDTGDTRVFANSTLDAAGNVTSEDKGIIFDSIDPSLRHGAAGAFGASAGATGTIQLELSESEYQEIRQRVSDRYDRPLGAPGGFDAVTDSFLENATYDDFLRDPRLRGVDSGLFGTVIQQLGNPNDPLPGTVTVS